MSRLRQQQQQQQQQQQGVGMPRATDVVHGRAGGSGGGNGRLSSNSLTRRSTGSLT
jgi:hypothetical protein